MRRLEARSGARLFERTSRRVSLTAAGPSLHRLIDAFQIRHPDCQVILHEVNTWDPYPAVRRGDVDVLVNWLAVDELVFGAGLTQ